MANNRMASSRNDRTAVKLDRTHAEDWVVARHPDTGQPIYASDPIYSAGDYAGVIVTDDERDRLSILDILDEVAKRMIRRSRFQDERLFALNYRTYGDYVYRMLRDLHSATGKMYAEDVPAAIFDAASYQMNYGVWFMLQPKIDADAWTRRLAAVRAQAEYIPAGYGPWAIFPKTIDAIDEKDRSEPGFQRVTQVLYMKTEDKRGRDLHYALGYDGDQLALPWTRREAETAPAWIYENFDSTEVGETPIGVGILSDEELEEYGINLSVDELTSDAETMFGCDRSARGDYHRHIEIKLPALDLVVLHSLEDFEDPVVYRNDTWGVEVVEQRKDSRVYKLSTSTYSILLAVDDTMRMDVESVDGLDDVDRDGVVAGGAVIRAFNYASEFNPACLTNTHLWAAVKGQLDHVQKAIAELRVRGFEKYPQAMGSLTDRLGPLVTRGGRPSVKDWVARERGSIDPKQDPLLAGDSSVKPTKKRKTK
jgi:hypothetical protein